MKENRLTTSQEEGLFYDTLVKVIPYWPLFAVLLLVFSLGGWGYIRFYATPMYEATAALLIKDEKKGVSEAKMTESIDAFTTNKIVENEINVIQSRALMKQVVNALSLYAPIYEEGKFKPSLAYSNSPIKVRVKSPAKIKDRQIIYFSYDDKNKTVVIEEKTYPLNKWIKTAYGELKFSKNNKRSSKTIGQLFIVLVNPKLITDYLVDMLSIQGSSKLSTVLVLKLQDEDPHRAEDILNNLILAYNQMAVEDREKLATSTLKFVEDRIKLVEKDLNLLEAEGVSYKSNNDAVDLNEQGKLILKNIGENNRRISDINTQIAILNKVEKYIFSKNNKSGIMPSTLGTNDPVLAQLLQRLYNAEIEYEKIKNNTAENNPIRLAITKEIENIKPSISENIINQRSNLLASRSNLISTNNMYNSAMQAIPQKERELQDINRQQLIKNDAYSFLLQKREETVLAYAPTAADSKIVDMAEASLIPVSPKKPYIFLTAIFSALGLGILYIISKESLNSKILFRSEIEQYTRIPVIAELSFTKNLKKESLTAQNDVGITEQFRQLRATLGLYGRMSIKKRIMVTSNIPGEGKSFVSTNLAKSLSSSGKKVVIVDIDLRNPKTSMLFDASSQTGMSDFLTGDIEPKDIILETCLNCLWIVPAGTAVGDYTELLLTKKLDDFFTYLENSFDYIIIDTPPVNLISDAYLLAEFSDISLLIVRHNHTPKNLIKFFAEKNKITSLGNVSIIFNGVKPRGFIKEKYGYGYGYGHETKYGNKIYENRRYS